MSTKVIEAELRIVGADKSGPAWAGVIKHAEEAARILGRMKNLSIGSAEWKAANAAIKEQTKLLRTERVAATELERALRAVGQAAGTGQGRLARLRAGAGALASKLGLPTGLASLELARGARATLSTYREFDKERRFGKAVMGLTDEQQEPLVKQAIGLGASTKYNDIKVLEAQRELAARGLTMAQVLGVIPAAANLGQATDRDLPEAVKQIEGAIFGFKKDISTTATAIASATQTADIQTKVAKISGMTPEDIVETYKYGATPARLAGISEQTLLAFAGVAKKANIGGDEAGVAFRALVSSGMSPTRKGKEALLANGLNFADYQKNPSNLAVAPFVTDVAQQYGVRLGKNVQAGLAQIFGDKSTISDPAKFTPAVVSLLKRELSGNDAKSLRSIAGAAGRYRDASMTGVDMNRFIADLLPKLSNNIALSNAVFGPKQGARIAGVLGDPETLKHFQDLLTHDAAGYAEKIATERMSGFDGAVSRMENATKNFETAIGRMLDKNGSGGLLTGATNTLGNVIQWGAEHPVPGMAIAGGGAFASAAVMAGFLKSVAGGFGLSASAVALDGAATALSAAAVKLGGGVPGVAGVPGDKAGKLSRVMGMLGTAWAVGAPIASAAVLGYGLWQLHDEIGDSNPAEIRRAKQGGGFRDAMRRAFSEEREAMGLPAIGGGAWKDLPLKPWPEGGKAAPVEVYGSADIKNEVSIKLNTQLFEAEVKRIADASAARVALTSKPSTGSAGSTGQSMPEAGASGH
jgi:TP901 family phage tail tape measure protein